MGDHDQRNQQRRGLDIAIDKGVDWQMNPSHTESCKYIHDLHYLYSKNQTYMFLHEVGFEPTRFTTAGLKSASLDHSDIRAFE